MDDKLETLNKTGTWWSDSWWLDERWIENLNETRDDVEKAVEYLKGIFTSDWLKNYTGNPVANVLLRNTQYGQGLPYLENLISLSQHLKELEKIPTINAVIKNLKSSHESDSANMELELGYVFHNEGYTVEFPVPKSKKNKTPDVIVEKGNEKFAVECKKLKISKFESWIDQVLRALSIKAFNLAEESGFGIRYEFSKEIMPHLHSLYKNNESIEVPIDNLLMRLSDSINRVSNKNHDWACIINENIGEGYISRNLIRTKGLLRTPEIPNSFKFGRLFENGIKNAMSQLTNLDCPGIAVIHLNAIPDYDFISDEMNKVFFANSETYSNIIGILVFPWQNMFERSQPCFVVNKTANFDIENSNMIDVIKKYHDPVWM